MANKTKEQELQEEQLEREDTQEQASDLGEQEQQDPEVAELKKQLEEALAQVEEYKDGWQRSRAEFANYKKRIERERSQIYQNAAGEIIKRFLDIADDLQRALDNRPQEGEGAVWADGIELIYRKLLTIIENEGITPMETEGQTFDPNLHEAISLEDSPDHESGEIIEVLKKGYMLGDRVLRPATVRVAS